MKSKFLAIIIVFTVVLSVWGVMPVMAAPEATLTWDGRWSTNWNTAANWTPAQVPTAIDNVIIGNRNVNYQPVLSASTTVASLTINSRSQTNNTRGGCLTINAGVTLNVAGNVAINGSTGGNTGVTCGGNANRTGIIMNTTAWMTVGGNVTLTNSTGGPPEEAMIVMGSGTLYVAGNWTKGSASIFTAGTGTVIFNGTGAQSIGGSTTTFNNLTVNKTSGTLTLGVNSTVAGNLTASAGTLDLSTFTINRSAAGGTLTIGNGATLRIGGTNTLPSNYSTHSIGATSTVDYYGTTQTVATLNSAQSYGNLIVSGPNIKTLAGATAVAGNLTISAGTLAANNNNLSVAGNFINSGAFTAGTGTVTFNGGTQNLTANTPTAFNNLTVNNGVLLIETVAADNATVAGTLTNNGTIRKSQNVAGTGAQTFGLAGAYNGAALSINATSQGTLSSLQVDRIDSNHPTATSGPGGSGTATGRYWNITPTGDAYSVDLTLPHSITPDTNAAACEYTGGPGDGWDCARTSSTGNTVTRVGVTTLSPWAVGNNVGPTAVALESMSAHAEANGAGQLLAVAALLLSGSLVFTLARRKAN